MVGYKVKRKLKLKEIGEGEIYRTISSHFRNGDNKELFVETTIPNLKSVYVVVRQSARVYVGSDLTRAVEKYNEECIK